MTVNRIRIHHDGDPLRRYEVEFVGAEGPGVRMGYSDLASKRAFQRRTLECFDQLIDPPSRVELNRLLADAEHVYPKDFPAPAPSVLRVVK